MPFKYQSVLMVGATSGIGAALGDRLIEEGSKVIAVGRRQERLDAFVRKHQQEKAAAINFDISNKQGMDAFVAEVTAKHPDIDCVFLNAGQQHPVNLAEPAKVDLSRFHAELDTNFTCMVDLSLKFLPFLMGRKSETGLIFTSSSLALIPATTLSVYSASKAAMNSYIMSLRDQLRHSTVKIVELWPPVVQTELHDWQGERGRSFGMPIDKFTDEAYQELLSDKDLIIIGGLGAPGAIPDSHFREVERRRQAAFANMCHSLRGEDWTPLD